MVLVERPADVTMSLKRTPRRHAEVRFRSSWFVLRRPVGATTNRRHFRCRNAAAAAASAASIKVRFNQVAYDEVFGWLGWLALFVRCPSYAGGFYFASSSAFGVDEKFLPLLSTLVNHTKTVRGKQVFCMISRDRGMQYGRFSTDTSQIKMLN